MDTGIGIAKDDLDKIFKVGRRGSNVGARAGDGIGLGFVEKAVYVMNGEIDVQSEEGKGSTFIVTLTPALSAEIVTAGDTVTEQAVSGQSEVKESIGTDTKGGIDFNPDFLKIQAQGNSVDFPLSIPLDGIEIEINGLVPSIYTIIPVQNVSTLLSSEISAEDPPALSYSLPK